MEAAGFDEVWVDSYGSVVGRLKGKRKGPVLFDTHMDTVGPGDLSAWRYGPFDAQVVEGRIYGRGASDAKGALAATLAALCELKRAGLRPACDVYLACVVMEELYEGLATKRVVEETGTPRAVIVGEPTSLNVAIGHKGRAVVRIRTRGKAAHASMPDLGVNAVYEMVPVIEAVRSMKLPSHPVLGRGTVAVTNIECKPGVGPVIPDECTITVDRRLVGESEEQVIDSFKAAIAVVCPDKNVEVALVEEDVELYTSERVRAKAFFPAWTLDAEHRVVKAVVEAVSSAMAQTPSLVTWRFSTDGAYTAGVLGVPTVGFGPGEERLAHAPNEYVEINQLVRAAEAYAAIALTFAP